MSPIKPTTRRLPLTVPLPVVTILRLLLLLKLLGCELHSDAFAQHVDSFDQGARRFSLWRDDARTVMRSIQQPTPTPAEPGVETIEFTHGNGSFIYLISPIEPCAIIPELNASIRIRSAQAGMRIGLRVVFPKARHPATHAALTEVVFGIPNEGAGRWSTSAITNVVNLLEERQRFLRRLFGPDVDLREPYVDAILLSVYGYPGTTKLQVDDLVVDGMIAPSTLAMESSSDPATATLDEPPSERLRRIQQTVPRWIQHQGESLPYLQSLGFNAVVARNPNDPLIADQAIASGMSVVAPPPSLIPSEDQAASYEHISAWLLGLALNQNQLPSSRDRVAQLSRFPKTLAKPTIAEAWELYGTYSQLSDWLAVPTPLPTTVRSSKESAELMLNQRAPISARNLPMTSLWTQPSNEWLAQRAMASSTLGRDPWLLVDHDRLHTRLQWIRSVMQGARGWIFRSPSSLDAGSDTANARAETFANLNREIDLLLPWIQASESAWTPIATSSNAHSAAMLETPASQLVLAVASGEWDTICSPAPNTERLTLTIPVGGQPRQVYRITHGDLERLPTQLSPGAMQITIDQPALIEQVVSMVDTGPLNYLRDALRRQAPSLIENNIDTAGQLIQLAQMTLVARQLPASEPHWDSVREAQSAHRAALQLLANSELPRASQAAQRATTLAQRTIRNSWNVAHEQFPSINSSPLIASPLSLPLHFELDRVLQNRTWQSLPLPGVPFSDLSAWQSAGWESNHRLTDSVNSSIEMQTAAGPNAQPTLILQSTSRTGQPIPTGYAGASMRITSPTVELPAGALVHIEGLVLVESPSNESQSGLLVCDNMGGEALGQLISSYDDQNTNNPPRTNAGPSWKRISLFRMITDERKLELYFETRGAVRAMITDLSLEWITPSQNRNLPISTSSESTLLVPAAPLPGAPVIPD